MPQIINTNILAINAQRQLNKSQSSQATSIERLSSGLRINSAKDDAAGLAISTRFETQIRGLNQAVRNANDGISLAQTAEGSLQEMGNILQRMRELAVQSSNDSNSDQDRLSIQAEVDQLYDELDRISESTEFNGVKLLDGTAGTRTFQIGANAGQSLDFSLDSVTTQDLNLNGFSALGELNGGRIDTNLFQAATGASTVYTTIIAANSITINGIGVDAFVNTSVAATLTDVENIINNKTGLTGVTATAYNVVTGGIGVSGNVGTSLIINGATVTKSGSVTELVDNINRDVAGVTAALGSNGEVILSNDTGNTITVAASATDASASGLSAGSYQGYLGLESFTGEEIELGFDEDFGGSETLLNNLGFNVSSGSDSMIGAETNGSAITASDGIEINGIELGKIQNGTTTTISAADIAFGINAVSDQTGVEATATTTVKYTIVISSIANSTDSDISINSIQIDEPTAATLQIETLDEFVQLINNSGIQGVVASVDSDTGKLQLTSDVGVDIVVSESTAGEIFQGVTATTDTTRGKITLTSENGQDVTISSNAIGEAAKDTALAKLGFIDQGGNTTAIGLGLSVTTVGNSQVAIERIDDALDTISSVRANLGAFQNRLGSTIANLENVSQNLSAANSRIRDADFAVETANLTKTQILQQAGIAMLSQANASQQNVLSLLG